MLKRTTDARWLIPIVLVCGLTAQAQDQKPSKEKDKAKQPPAQTVDSGSFGVFIKGQRVVTETFSVQQQSGLSIIKSHLKDASGTNYDQSSEMQIMPNAQLVRYEWDETTPAVSSLVVTPSNEFLIEKITLPTSAKPAEQPFLMPNTSMILDNNFFVHREVLLWRYLAADCHPEGGNFQCQKGPVEFGVLVPQDRNSMRVRLELVGKEKVTIRGAERELLRLNLSGDGFNWALWVDDHDQFKLMRVAIPADNTEVVRD
jgi:hypothetical protein